MEKISIRNLGPITEADITFGDLTILVGPQASGKSILLQMVKLISDTAVIHERLRNHGYIWTNEKELLESYLGEGMSEVWNSHTIINSDDKLFSRKLLVNSVNNVEQKVFYIPAQRVIAIQNGWPKPFGEYGNDPYVLKAFSDALRAAMEFDLSAPYFVSGSGKKNKDHLYRGIYYNGEFEIDVKDRRRRFVLNIEGNKIPYSVWSAGQREFMPLWLGVNLLVNTSYRNIKVAIIEEPEMGLHPAAIKQVIILLLELIGKGYKVIISTHSPVFLEFAWAFKILQEEKASAQALIDMFEVNKADLPQDFFTDILSKSVRTYYFNRKENGVVVKDISSLDAGSEDADISEWGGLSSFGSKASEVVAKNVAL